MEAVDDLIIGYKQRLLATQYSLEQSRHECDALNKEVTSLKKTNRRLKRVLGAEDD